MESNASRAAAIFQARSRANLVRLLQRMVGPARNKIREHDVCARRRNQIKISEISGKERDPSGEIPRQLTIQRPNVRNGNGRNQKT